MILTQTNQTLELKLGGAVATSQCPIIVDYVDFTPSTTTPGLQASLTDDLSSVSIADSPGASTQRKINSINIHNIDTIAIVVTVQINDNDTIYEILNGISVPVGGILQFTDREGWSVVGREGGERDLRSGWVQEFTANGTWVKPGNCRFFLVECVGGGGGGRGGNGGAADTVRNGGPGGGGAFRARRLMLAKDLPALVSVTVSAQASGGTGGTNGIGSNGSAGGTSNFGSYVYAYGGGGAGTNGGGGGGATSAGTVTTGGSAMLDAVGAHVSDARGSNIGFASYLGGAAGGSLLSTGSSAGSTSFFSAGGGAGGQGLNSSNSPGTGPAAGGNCGGAVTGVSGGGGLPGLANVRGGGIGGTVAGFCGQGGGGGGASTTGTGFNGGDGGFPGGGGAGGGAGTDIGGNGGKGAAGVVRVWGW